MGVRHGSLLRARSAAAKVHAQKEYDVASILHDGTSIEKVHTGLSKVRTFFFTLDSGMKKTRHAGINAIKYAPIKFHKRLNHITNDSGMPRVRKGIQFGSNHAVMEPSREKVRRRCEGMSNNGRSSTPDAIRWSLCRLV